MRRAIEITMLTCILNNNTQLFQRCTYHYLSVTPTQLNYCTYCLRSMSKCPINVELFLGTHQSYALGIAGLSLDCNERKHPACHCWIFTARPMTHTLETGTINRLHVSVADFWYVCRAHLVPDSSGTRFWRRLEDCSIPSQKVAPLVDDSC